MKFNTKIHKTYNYIIRFAIVIATYGFVYKQIFHQRKLETVAESFQALIEKPGFIFLLLIVFVMMFVNWGIESLKWQFLINKLEKIPLIRAFEAVLTGVSVSIFTPNRVGEYFGRVFILRKANPWQGVFVTIIGSMSQLLTTVIMGSLALVFFIPKYFSNESYYNEYLYIAVLFFLLILNIILILLFLNVSALTTLAYRLIPSGWKKVRKYLSIFSFYTTKELAEVLFLSISRYLVFSSQFYLLLIAFSVQIPFFDGMILIAVVFFVLTAIPTITLAELGIRGTVAITIFGMYFDKFGIVNETLDLAAVSTSSTLWLVNLVIPALVGTVFVFKLRFFRKNSS